MPSVKLAANVSRNQSVKTNFILENYKFARLNQGHICQVLHAGTPMRCQRDIW